MQFFITILLLVPAMAKAFHEYHEANITKTLSNKSDVKKDMYVIHAIAYQVGIITNKTSNETDTNLGKEEAITFFQSNGSKVDLSQIPQPLLTNVTAQSLVGIIPGLPVEPRKSQYQHIPHEMQELDANSNEKLYKRSNIITGDDTVKIKKGVAVIPKEAGVHSLAIPPLLALNNNFTNIPVPIPNTSVVHYAKINTLVHLPGL